MGAAGRLDQPRRSEVEEDVRNCAALDLDLDLDWDLDWAWNSGCSATRASVAVVDDSFLPVQIPNLTPIRIRNQTMVVVCMAW